MADALAKVELPLNWSTEPLPGGGYRWTRSGPDTRRLSSKMTPRAGTTTTWDVRTFTEMPGHARRAKNKKENWRSKLSRTDAQRI